MVNPTQKSFQNAPLNFPKKQILHFRLSPSSELLNARIKQSTGIGQKNRKVDDNDHTPTLTKYLLTETF